jgi:hypothetical protein
VDAYKAASSGLRRGSIEIIAFGQAQGADFHCQLTGSRLAHTQMLDWLADYLPSREAGV